ncbi:hypothetical protein CPLU01_03772 [Colletotrichum plurivorum]|uniref:Uncharacterized protein n=1 Tax=Colletotrichum plurivorum TaxID=2175906 RepID=A0A8H6KRA3_9PEZI|nr:hypothetical protein CPLU01_03772 [Colletotrichum plurivorum]
MPRRLRRLGSIARLFSSVADRFLLVSARMAIVRRANDALGASMGPQRQGLPCRIPHGMSLSRPSSSSNHGRTGSSGAACSSSASSPLNSKKHVVNGVVNSAKGPLALAGEISARAVAAVLTQQ